MKYSKIKVFYLLFLLVPFVFIYSCDKEEELKMPTLATTEVSEITALTAISGGVIIDDAGSTITARGVCWSTETDPTVTDSKTVDGAGGGTYSSTLTDLLPNTTYFVRAYATNGIGTGYGMTMSFKTLDGVSSIITGDAREIMATSAQIGNNINDDGGSEVTSRGVCWSLSENPSINDNYTSDGSGLGSFTSNLTELVPGNNYYARAYATNNVGTSYGNQISFTTLDGVIAITTAEVASITGTSVISGGNITDDGGAEVTSRGVLWGELENSTLQDCEGFTQDGVGTGMFESSVTGLSLSTNYFLRAYAINSTGVSYGNQHEFQTNNIDVSDGFYVFGDATAVTDYEIKGLMTMTKNEVNGSDRSSLLDIYIAVSETGGFNIGRVTGGATTVYGPSDDFTEVLDEDKIGDEPRGWFSRGSLVESNTQFTVPESGLYHVVYDTELNVAVVAKVEWGIIGNATPDGWSSSTPLTASAFDLNAMSFETTELILIAGDYKFRYSNGWKIEIDGELVRVNTNFGGSLDELVPGGNVIINETPGYYTVTVNWSLSTSTSISLTKTGDYIPPTFPEAMYIVGDATAYGWDTPGNKPDAIMHKLAGGEPTEGVFWKICHIDGGLDFRLAAANWDDLNLGYDDIVEYDTDGFAVLDNYGSMSVAESGMYMVVLDLRDNLKKLSIKSVEVYGIGDAFGGWGFEVPANKFIVANAERTVTSPALPASGDIRIYAYHPWIPAWWNSEFNVFSGEIEYRNDGGDQVPVAGASGQIIVLYFDDNTGYIQ